MDNDAYYRKKFEKSSALLGLVPGVTITYRDDLGGYLGFCRVKDGEVEISQREADPCVLDHELGHIWFYRWAKSSNRRVNGLDSEIFAFCCEHIAALDVFEDGWEFDHRDVAARLLKLGLYGFSECAACYPELTCKNYSIVSLTDALIELVLFVYGYYSRKAKLKGA